MKLRMFGLLFTLPLLCVSCEESGATPEEETVAPEGGAADSVAEANKAAEAAAEAVAGTAAEDALVLATCTGTVAAATTKTAPAVVAVSAPGSDSVVTAAAVESLAKALMGGTCGDVKVNGDSAAAMVTVGGAAKEVKFLKGDGGWRFDAKAWFDANPPPAAPEPKAKKKGKKKKGKKKKKK